MKKSRILCVFLVALLLMSCFTGCGSKPSSEKQSGVETSDNTKAVRTILVAHNQTSLDNPYVIATIKFKEALEEISGGKIAVELHHGTLGENDSELVEKLDMGAVQIILASPGFMTSTGVNEVDIFSLPYLFDSFDHWETAMDGQFGEDMKSLVLEKTNNRFHILRYWTASVRDYYGKKQVVKPSDLAGMTIRCKGTPVMQDFWEQCGAVPTSVAWGEMYQALSQGVIDCAENDYTSLRLKDHHKTNNGKYISETHHDFTTVLFMCAGSFYDSLSEEEKGWIEEAATIATQENREVTYRMFEESKQIVIDDGAIVTNYEDVDIAAFKAIAIPIQDQFAQENGMEEQLAYIRSLAE